MTFFMFKQKTAYEMRISDWMSDVCSSDLSLIEMLVKIHNSPILCAHVRHRLKPSFVIHADRLRPRVQSRRLAVARPAARCPSRCRCRSEEHTSELQSLMRISYAVFCLKKKKPYNIT